MSLTSKLKGWWSKQKKKSQQSAKKAYTKKVASDRVQRKNKSAGRTYDSVRQKAAPKVSKPSGSSGGSSSNRRSTGWGSTASKGGTAQHRSGAATQRKKTTASSQKKSNQTGWQSYVQNTLKSIKSSSQNSAQEAYQKKVKENRNALGTTAKTRTVNTSAGKLKSKDLTTEEYLKLQNASRVGGKAGTAALGKELAEKVGSRTAYSAKKGKVATGIMQGLAYGDVLEGGVGTYNKKARAAVEDTKKSTAYNVGYGVGQMAGFALGGTNSAAKSLVQGGAKAAGKRAAKKGAESAAKKFAKNRAAEMAVETPMNIADAIKMSRDENGKIDKKKLAGYAALNTGLTGGTGAIMEGAAIKFTKKNGQELIKLQAKANKGNITKEEGQKLKKLYDKLNAAREDTTSARSNIADESYQEARSMVNDARLARGKAKGAQRAEAAQAARTKQANEQVERTVKRAKESEQRRATQAYNDRLTDYVENLKERNRQAINDREVIRRNQSLVDEGGTTATAGKAPDVETIPKGMKVDKVQARSSKKAVKEALGGNHTPQAKKEIEDSVDRISNMIRHGDAEDARIEARRLVEKHGKTMTEERTVNPEARQKLRGLQNYISRINFRPSDDVFKAVNAKGRHKDLREAIGDFNPYVLHVTKNKTTGTGQTSIDSIWDELAEEYPEYFTRGLTDETEMYRELASVSNLTAKDTDTVLPYDDDMIAGEFESMVDRVFREAEKNADAYKSTAKGAEPEGRAGVPESRRSYDETPVENTDRSGGPESLGSIMGRVKENIGKEGPKATSEDTAASAKALRGTENARAEAESRMQNAKNAKRNKDIDAYIKSLREKDAAKRAKQTPEERTKEHEEVTKADAVVPSKVPEKDTSDVIGASKPPEQAAEAKVAEIKDFSNNDKAFKISSKNVVDNAPDKAEEVGKLVDQYNELGKKIAANKKKIENSNTPEHIEKYKKEIESIEKKQKELLGEMKKLEDTYVARYKDGESVLSDINPDDTKGAIQGKTGKVRNRIRTIRRLTENSLLEFERVAKATKNEKLLNAVNNVIYARNKAGAWIESARSSFADRTGTGKSLNQIFKDAGAFKSKETRTDFNTYALLRHHIDRAEKGKPVFMKDGKTLSIPDAKAAMERLEKKYDAVHGTGKGKAKLEQFSDDLTAYSNDLLKYRYDAGLITKEVYEKTLKDYPHYVPTYRIADDASGFVYHDAGGASLDAVLKSAKGGETPIEDLYSQLHKITNDVIANAEQNEMVKLYAQDMGFKPEQLAKEVDLEDLEKARIKADKNGTITFYQDGQRVTLNANEQAVKGLREWTGQDYALYCNALAKMGRMTGIRIFKGLITDWNVAFGLRNGARDFQQALVNSKNTRWFARSMPAAFHAVTHKNNAYRRLYEMNGGKYFTPSGDPRTVKDPTKTSAFEKFIKPAEAFNGAIEMNPRMCEFIGTINKEAAEKLKGKGKTLKDLRKEAEEFANKNAKTGDDPVAMAEEKYAELVCNVVGKDTVDRAMRNAADITLNFSRSGAIVKGLNSGAVPYLNPSVQGLSKTIRLFSEGRADKALISIGAKLSLMTVAPALANEYFMRNNRDFQDLNTRDKDTNFFIPIGDGKFIKIPKPRENAVLAEPFTYGMRYFFDRAQVGSIKPGEYSSAENWKQMFKTARDSIGPVNPLESNYFSPLFNTARNKTWYGGNIESVSDQKLPVRDRRDETTSALAILLADSKAYNTFMESNFAQSGVGKMVASNMSPKKIDNLMDSYFGMIYDMGIKPTAANRDMGSTPANIQNYFTNQFILDGVYSNKLADQYYTKLDKLNKGAKEGEYTYKAKVYMNDYGYDAMNYSSARAAVFGDDKDFKKLSAKEKQALSRGLKKSQNDVYRDAASNEKGTFGSFEDNFKNDPFRVMARELKKVGFQDKTGKMAEEKVLESFTYTNDKGKNMVRDAFEEYKKSEEYKSAGKEKGVKSFFNDTVRTRGLLGEAGASKSFPTWTAVSLVAAERNKKAGNDSHTAFAKAYGASEETQQEAKNYLDFDYTLKNYAHTHKTLERMAMRAGKYLNEMDDNKKSVALANKKYSDGSFYIEGKYVDHKCNYARCIASDGVTSKEYNKWMDDNGLRSYSSKAQEGLQKMETSKGKTYYKSSEEDVINAIEKDYGDRSNEFKAAMFRMFYEYGDNPYGEVGDYSQSNDRGLRHDDGGYGGYGRGRGRRRGRRGYGRRGYGGYGGGGGYGSAAGKDWYTFAGEIFDMNAAGKTKVGKYGKQSEINEAYRRRARKKQMINNKS